MFVYKRIDLADNERAFLFKKNRFSGVLKSGSYRYVDLFGDIRVERFDIAQRELQHKLGKFLVSNFAEQSQDYLQAYQLSEVEAGLLYVDDQLIDILAPGSFKIYWTGPEKIEIKRVDISQDYRVSTALLSVLGHTQVSSLVHLVAQVIYYTEVQDNHVGLLLVDGKLETILQPGKYGFWKYQRNIVVKHTDLRLQNIEISGQEILTKDRVSLRLNLSAAYRIEDAELIQGKLSSFDDFLYREFQLQLREAVGTKSLDMLLADKDTLNQTITEGIRQRVGEYGITVKSVGIRDIILPGDMKVILNQVVEAEKAAEANLIKRREETAATRSLHNTAKLMENNPTLMRLKELEVLEKVTERVGNLNVYSGLEGVMHGLVKAPLTPKQ